uniref:RRM domain-containing protein n=1 Tax=Ananas comosus var. bracteatus TaxID=296719 RepID=A0A6V7PBL6_ANACO|nr:unnamed protein product [Ananas comosus var. bracteatus]
MLPKTRISGMGVGRERMITDEAILRTPAGQQQKRRFGADFAATQGRTAIGKRCGFVQFANRSCAEEALKMLNGSQLGGQNIRLSGGRTPANKRLNRILANGMEAIMASYQTTQGTESENDPNNTTIFVGGLDSSKRCGFVQFANRSCAEEALKMLNGSQLGGQNIRLSCGRTTANKQDPNQWNGSYYGYAQSYDTYGYAPRQDPNMYAYASYPEYRNYQQQPQQQQ